MALSLLPVAHVVYVVTGVSIYVGISWLLVVVDCCTAVDADCHYVVGVVVAVGCCYFVDIYQRY